MTELLLSFDRKRIQRPLYTSWNSGTLELLELWNSGTLELWNSGTLELWNLGILEPRNSGILLPAMEILLHQLHDLFFIITMSRRRFLSLKDLR